MHVIVYGDGKWMIWEEFEEGEEMGGGREGKGFPAVYLNLNCFSSPASFIHRRGTLPPILRYKAHGIICSGRA